MIGFVCRRGRRQPLRDGRGGDADAAIKLRPLGPLGGRRAMWPDVAGPPPSPAIQRPPVVTSANGIVDKNNGGDLRFPRVAPNVLGRAEPSALRAPCVLAGANSGLGWES